MATTWYLDHLASGTNSGTLANPWKTLSAVSVASMASGDTLLVMGGAGEDYSLDAGGTVGEFGISPGAKTGITYKINPASTGQAIFNSIGLYSAAGCVIDGLVPATGGFKRWTDGTTSPTAKNDDSIQWFKVIGTSGSKGGTANSTSQAWIRATTTGAVIRGVEVDGSLVVHDFTSERHGCSAANDTANWLFEYNYVHDTVGDGINGQATNALNPSYANTSFTVGVMRYNRILREGDDGGKMSSNFSFYGNFVDQTGVPVYLGSHPDGFQWQHYCTYCKFYNNVWINAGQQPFLEKVAGENYCYNNIILNTRTGAIGNNGVGQTGGTVYSAIDGNFSNGIASITFSGTTATVTTTLTMDGLSRNLPKAGATGVTISGATGADAAIYNGTFTIQTVPDSTHFTYTMGSTPAGNATGTLAYNILAFGNVVFANNLIYGYEAIGSAINGGLPNTAYATRTTTGNIVINAYTGAPSTDQYWLDAKSIWFDTTSPAPIFYDNTGAIHTVGTRYMGSAVNEDPGLVNLRGFDFHPASAASNCVTIAATDLTALGITTDFDGNPRPNGSAWTAGPYQWQGSLTTGTLPVVVNYFQPRPYILGLVGSVLDWYNFSHGGQGVFQLDPSLYTFSVTGLPAGVTFDTTHGVVTGTPTTAGTYAVSMTALLSGTPVATQGLLIAVQNTSASPAIVSPLTATGTNGVAFSYQIQGTNQLAASGAPAAGISFNATGLPAWASVSSSTGLITGTPNANGTTNVTISATNTTATGSATLVITIGSGSAPAINSSLTDSFTAGNTHTYQITATNSPTSYDATGLPSGGSRNTSTGLISFTAGVAAGTYNITISATNASGTGTATLVETVNAGVSPPVITSGTFASGTTGSAFTYQITASNTPTSYDATGLPAWASVNTATGAITGTPNAVAVTNAVVKATNASGTGTQGLAITITDTTPPTPNPSTIASASALSSTSITVTATTATDSNTPPVFYAFSNDNGVTYSPPQSSPTFVFTGLTPRTLYHIVVQVQDSAPVPNLTTPSAASNVTTNPPIIIGTAMKIVGAGSF
jgi:hypothetical protein